ncbi:cytochrome P450 [Nonomuraea zeae]|uniref:Cytochrome P450 n=1 Tax=Nonomuraea zeae TaxID=1642303 RepID=A0A5S4GUX7_9ACTN|nr:cytochrome P450 [Nonomuraea zeae]TMR36743.1 cytochrome P450 [Nonomuraea zeae]
MSGDERDEARRPEGEARCPYPFPRPSALEVPYELAEIRERPVVPITLPSGDGALLVTRYADVRRLLLDERLSRNLGRPGAARIAKNNRMFQDPRIDPDPPAHTRVRRLVMRAFTPARVEALRPYIHSVVDELLTRMARHDGAADLNEALAFPLPIRVICRLLGVPERDTALFRDWTDHFLSVSRFPPEEIKAAMADMNRYIGELIAAKRAEPGDDLVSALIQVRDQEDGRLAEHELHWWCRLLLLVGYETTATQLGGGVALLLSHPEQLALLRADYGRVPAAVEECLRWKLVGSSVSMLRYAIDDIEMDGYTIPKGASVIPAVDSANQDATAFDRPGEFDITREDVGGHLTFSVGPHFCVGAALARTQLQIATESLLRRFPRLRLAVPAKDLRRHEGSLLEAFTEIPVTW